MLLELSIQKSKVTSSRICFFANTYREGVMLLEFSIQKFKEAKFSFEPTNHSHFAPKINLAKKALCVLEQLLIKFNFFIKVKK